MCVLINKNQAQPIDPDLTAKLLGRGVAVSPIVTVEPRRRKFHKAITLSMPAPKAHSQGMINQYSGNAPTLRLLCSITGKPIFNYFFQFIRGQSDTHKISFFITTRKIVWLRIELSLLRFILDISLDSSIYIYELFCILLQIPFIHVYVFGIVYFDF